ncbi:DnaJ domain-containing protein [Acinetobacter pittii]|uniref:J domain-containing protein n=1 Tax=Acinetobacter pittii TaxID=48296 RepID=UPI0018FFA6C2|nr:DnaJ domain-containing protein [Acinetobacter pittii]MBJ8478493.1 DnaJ domain-containing protein [Acinetobacter pittii]MCU4339269.1 DnaJ domain-containing protein [Acinetobacter pittii]MCU4558961.1 DnaJ domain-containing protein [Acinetobacter pittii]
MNTFINYYEILHVSQDAPIEIIRLAYKGLAQKYHPDRYQGKDANEKMQLINEALEVLTNENKRKEFDLKLNAFNQRKQKERDFQEYQKRKKYEDFQQQEKNSRDFSKNDDKDQKEAKDFNVNININISKGFYIFKPFLNLYNMIKRNSKKIIISLSILGVAIILISTILSIYENTRYSENIVSEGPLPAEQVDETVNTLYASTSESVSTPELVNTTNEQSKVIPYRPDLMNKAVQSVINIQEESGIIGVVKEIHDCYINKKEERLYCLFLDLTARMLDSGASQTMGIIRDDYLMDERVLTRINNNYYIPNSIDSSTATEHVQRMNVELAEIFKEKYQEKIKNMHSSDNLNKSVEEELSDVNNDEVKTDQPSSNLI